MLHGGDDSLDDDVNEHCCVTASVQNPAVASAAHAKLLHAVLKQLVSGHWL